MNIFKEIKALPPKDLVDRSPAGAQLVRNCIGIIDISNQGETLYSMQGSQVLGAIRMAFQF